MVAPHQSPESDRILIGDAITFWLSVFGGTLGGAALFGFIFGCFIGAVIGPIIAFVCGIPVCVSMSVVTWPIWRSRYYQLSAAMSGGCTGLLSTLWTGDYEGVPSAVWEITALLIGGSGACFSAHLFMQHTEAGYRFERSARKQVAQFSLRFLFLYITALTVVIVFWMWVFKAINAARNPDPLVTSNRLDARD